jgi:predicted Zn-dependent protease
MTSRVQIVLVNDPSFNAFVDGQRMFINTGALMPAQRFPTRSSACSPMRRATWPAAISSACANRSPLPGHRNRRRPAWAGAIAAGSISGQFRRAGRWRVDHGNPELAQRNLLSYRRSEEMNADQAAARYLDATGQSIRGMLTTFQRFSQSLSLSGVQVDQYQISHPLPRERIALLEELARKSRHFDARDPAALNHAAQSDASQDRRLYRRRPGGGQPVLG